MERQEVCVGSQKIEQSRPTGTDHQEVEWQFDGADLERVKGWLGEGHEGLGIFAESGEERRDRTALHVDGRLL